MTADGVPSPPTPARAAGRAVPCPRAGTSARLRRLLDLLPVGAALVDGDRVVVNAAVEAITGYAAGELATRGAWLAVLRGDPPGAGCGGGDDARRALPGARRATLRRKDGTLREVEVEAGPGEGEGDGDAGVWLLADVGAPGTTARCDRQRGLAALLAALPALVQEAAAGAPGEEPGARRRAETALEESEARLRGFFDAPGVLSCVFALDDAADDFVYVMPNRAFAAAYGTTVEALTGRRGRELGLPADRVAAWAGVLRRCRDTGEPAALELRPSRTVRPMWVLANVNRIGDDADGRALLAYVATDVTERRQLEEQLRQAQKMEAVGRLAGGVAHDFNNLLTVIGGNVEFLLAGCPPDDPRHADLAEIRRAAERAGELTRQLLTFSRRQVVAPRRVDLGALVGDAERMLRRLIGEDVLLTTSVAGDTPAVYADPGQLEQALVNLVVNARDAMPRGGHLAIETARAVVDAGPAVAAAVAGAAVGAAVAAVPPGEYAVLAVRDTGVGMDAATRARIFEPFFTTKEPGRGTGLGLATVFGIAAQAGGHVTVESVPGEGSTFRLHLPPAPGPASGDPSGDGDRAAAPAARGGTETVLVVEDEPHVRRLARRALAQRGYRVLEAADGDEALAVSDAHAGPIHLVLADAVLPGRSGGQLVETLATLRPGIASLVMSGYAPDSLPARPAPAPDEPFLEKPFTAEQLAAAVRGVLDGEG